jgi:hypothetical protein
MYRRRGVAVDVEPVEADCSEEGVGDFRACVLGLSVRRLQAGVT